MSKVVICRLLLHLSSSPEKYPALLQWWWEGGGGGCDVIINITEGVRTNFFVLEGGYCLSFC